MGCEFSALSGIAWVGGEAALKPLRDYLPMRLAQNNFQQWLRNNGVGTEKMGKECIDLF